ncbi:hypothetical protein GM418_23180 [Maribellus comscasis]|jgi:sensor histidine kinase YesM|uniref:Signal transduction histidine kinase internal region domain-containing protein n=1 Tax=Maribellus comscasis TaxID=2681766 RepID=A0A6I6JYQ1_9BACT|nr:histidine kinase [Maribellus comscasis]QGY46459.1 hypothetical protein GM418_23180 [Maribellus comscasis]
MQLKQVLQRNNWKIAVLFSAFLPLFNIIINSQHRAYDNITQLLANAFFTFSFLLISWFVNSYLTIYFQQFKGNHALLKKVILVLLFNAVLLTLFILAGVFFIREINEGSVPEKRFVLWLIIFKGAISISLIYIIQNLLNTRAREQEITLQNEMLKSENLRAQFEILRQQVNPHFLFNSLSTLRSMVRSNDSNAEEFVIKLSEMYRQLLDKQQKELVPLKEELDFVNDYLFMLSSRFGAMLKITFDIPEEIRELKIPTFSLQLLLENCVKHNIISSEHPLEIKVFATLPDSLTVENLLQPKISKVESSGYGLQSLIQRYHLLCYSDGVFIFSDDRVFRVKLKLIA